MAELQPIHGHLPSQDGVEFRPVKGFDRYAVSSDGQVWSRVGRRKNGRRNKWNLWRPVKPWMHKSGHLYIRLEWKNSQVHRLVLEAFGREPSDGEECRHLDGNPSNNAIENLAWGTRSENIADKVVHGTHNRGERHPSARLTNAEARLVREFKKRHPARRSGVVSFMSRWLGVSHSQVSEIARGRAYLA